MGLSRRRPTLLLLLLAAARAAEAPPPPDASETTAPDRRRPKKTPAEVAAEMKEMHDFWCHPGFGRAESALCVDIRRREAGGADADAPRAPRTKAEKAAVALMHELYCGVNGHAETKHPCLMWEARATRARRRRLVANDMKPDFVGMTFHAEVEQMLHDTLEDLEEL